MRIFTEVAHCPQRCLAITPGAFRERFVEGQFHRLADELGEGDPVSAGSFHAALL
jgi:hypothetical protein